jgi:2-amino-4-hydroxy-6-hydroxymethyldihydropteridine diphosphokinase
MTESDSTAYVGIGSNLNAPKEQVQSAIRALGNAPGLRLDRCSSLYSSPPMGPVEQPHYINAVVKLRTRLSSVELLQTLRDIEHAHGRLRDGVHWGPRTLDLDLLLYNDEQSSDVHLQLPHPGMKERDFVMLPLVEIAPDLILPCGTPARTIAQRLSAGASSIRLGDAQI